MKLISLVMCVVSLSSCASVNHATVELAEVAEHVVADEMESGVLLAARKPKPDELRYTNLCVRKDCGAITQRYTRLFHEAASLSTALRQLLALARAREDESRPTRLLLERAQRSLPALVEEHRDLLAEIARANPAVDFEEHSPRRVREVTRGLAHARWQLADVLSDLEDLEVALRDRVGDLEFDVAWHDPNPTLERQILASTQLSAELRQKWNGDVAAMIANRGRKEIERRLAAQQSLDQAIATISHEQQLRELQIVSLEISGSLDEATARAWFDDVWPVIAYCLSPEGAVEVVLLYSSAGAIDGVQAPSSAPGATECIQASLDDTMITDTPLKSGGLIQVHAGPHAATR